MSYSLYYSVLDFLSRASGLIFGLLIIIILLLLFIGTALDVMYICIPIFQSSMDKFLDGKRMGGFRLLSKDAVLAKEEADVSNTNVLFCYLKKRMFTYIIAAVLVYLLFVGPGPFVDFLWKVLEPFFEAVGLLIK